MKKSLMAIIIKNYLQLSDFKGIWKRWDTIVYWKEAEHGLKVAPKGFLEFVTQKLGMESSTAKRITDDPENQDLADERCLLLYLERHKDKLINCNVSSSSGISQTVSTVENIYGQLQRRYFGFETNGERKYFTRKEYNSPKLPLVM